MASDDVGYLMAENCSEARLALGKRHNSCEDHDLAVWRHERVCLTGLYNHRLPVVPAAHAGGVDDPSPLPVSYFDDSCSLRRFRGSQDGILLLHEPHKLRKCLVGSRSHLLI